MATQRISDSTWKKLSTDLLVTTKQDYDEEKYLLSYSNSNGVKAPLLSKGNISVVSGKAKSKKSFFCTLIAAHLFSDEIIDERLVVNIQEIQGNILYFDTEQAAAECQKVLKRLLVLGVEEDRIHFYRLRSLGTKERIQFIEKTLEVMKNVDVIILDGARDLVRSINSEEEATDITNLFMRWTDKYNVHLMTVLHLNKADSNLRGHIGSELQNKAESVFHIEKALSNNQSTVKMSHSRGVEADPFSFTISEEGVPSFGEYAPSLKKQSKKDYINSLSVDELEHIANAAFGEWQHTGLGYDDSITYLKEYMPKMGYDIGVNLTKNLFSRMKEENVISQNSLSLYFIQLRIDEKETWV